MKKILTVLLAASAVSAFAQVGDTPYTTSQQNSQGSSNLRSDGHIYEILRIVNDTNSPIDISVPDSDNLDCQVSSFNIDGKWWNCGDKHSPSHLDGKWLNAHSEISLAIANSGGISYYSDPSLAIEFNGKPGVAISSTYNHAYDNQYYVGGNKVSRANLHGMEVGVGGMAIPFIVGSKYSAGKYQVFLNVTKSNKVDPTDYQVTEVHILPHDTKTYNSADANNLGDSLQIGQSLSVGKELISHNGLNKLIVQGDGNIVLYNPDQLPAWDSYKKQTTLSAKNLILQGDGNLVAYTATGQVAWASNTAGADRLLLQDDGNLVLYRGNTPVWSTGTVYK